MGRKELGENFACTLYIINIRFCTLFAQILAAQMYESPSVLRVRRLIMTGGRVFKSKQGLLPTGWQETFWSPASRLSLALKSPANRLGGDLKAPCQPAMGILINKEIAF